MTRSIRYQSAVELGGRTSILTLQRADHERLDRLMRRAQATLGSRGPAHTRTLRAISRLVFTHAFAEEAVLFPAARRVLPEGDPLTLRIEEDHQEVNEIGVRIDGADVTAPGHEEMLRHAFAVLDHDVRTEEDELLPRLQQEMSLAQLRRLGRIWLLLRRTSPTRPHPVVSRRPPGQTLSALPLTVLDRSRDRVQWLDELTRGRLSRPAAAVDRVLADAAGRVERLPIIQRGERPETST